MNEDLIFWRNWSLREKAPLFLGLALLVSLLGYLFFSWYRGIENIISWDILTELKEKTVQTPALFFDQFSFSATSPLWYVEESYAPSPVRINTLAYTILLFGILAGISFILSGLSRLRGVWFLAGALLLGGILSSFHTESLFLVHRNWPFIGAFVIAGLTYYFTNLYARRTDILKNALIWLGVWVILAVVVWRFSLINEPFVSLSAFGLGGGLVVSFVFIFLISHEILAGMYRLVSDSAQKGRSSIPQLLVVTVVFLVNAVLIYLENAKRIDKTSYIFAPVVIYLLSLILGFWGFRNIAQQRNWFTYQGVGVWIYLGMAILSSAFVGTAYATANEPLTELIEDYISISFLSVGLCFFVYTLINFLPLIRSGLPFQKVLYKPPFSRLILARVAAVFIVFFLFSLKNRFSFFQLRSGLSNAIADFYKAEGDLKTAETYYKSGANYDLNNQRSNLSLASLSAEAGDNVNMVYFYQQSGNRTPSVYSYLGKGRGLEQENMFFDAIFVLKEGLEVFPEEHRLYTNLARLQAKAGMTDSVLIHLDKALQLCKNCEPENVNFLGFWIQNGKPEKLAEMRELAGRPEGFGFKANSSAIERMIGEETLFDDFSLPKDSALDMARAAYLLNAVSNPVTANKSGIEAKSLQSLQGRAANDPLYEQLSWGYANQQYFRGNKTEGLKQMTALAESSSRLAPLYHQNLGLWLMREGAYSKAVMHLERAGDSTSVRLLSGSDLKNGLDEQLKKQAETLTAELSTDNYREVVNKAPLNPWLLVKVADFLSGKQKQLEAYNIIFYALDFTADSPVLLEAYIRKSVDLSMFDYAEEALEKLTPMIGKEEQARLKALIAAGKSDQAGFK